MRNTVVFREEFQVESNVSVTMDREYSLLKKNVKKYKGKINKHPMF